MGTPFFLIISLLHYLTMVLVYSIKRTAYQIRYLLTHPEIIKKLGEYGHEYVKEDFLNLNVGGKNEMVSV